MTALRLPYDCLGTSWHLLNDCRTMPWSRLYVGKQKMTLKNIAHFHFSIHYFYCDYYLKVKFNWQWLSNAVFEEHFSTSKRHRVILIAYAQQDQSRNTLMHLHTLLSKNTYRVFNFYLVFDLCQHSEILNRPGLIRFKPSSHFFYHDPILVLGMFLFHFVFFYSFSV